MLGAGQAELPSGQIEIQPARNWESVGLPTRRAIRKAPTTETRRGHGQAFGASTHAAWRPDMEGQFAASNSHQCPDADVRVRLTVPQRVWSSRYPTPQRCVSGLAPAIVVVLLTISRSAASKRGSEATEVIVRLRASSPWIEGDAANHLKHFNL